MGQTVVIRDLVEMGETILIDTDRSFTGQDGQTITPDDPGTAVPAQLATELFALDLGIDHVYVLQNTISVRRPGGWDETSSQKVREAAGEFLRFYED
jgi:hypothetical protein